MKKGLLCLCAAAGFSTLSLSGCKPSDSTGSSTPAFRAQTFTNAISGWAVTLPAAWQTERAEDGSLTVLGHLSRRGEAIQILYVEDASLGPVDLQTLTPSDLGVYDAEPLAWEKLTLDRYPAIFLHAKMTFGARSHAVVFLVQHPDNPARTVELIAVLSEDQVREMVPVLWSIARSIRFLDGANPN